MNSFPMLRTNAVAQYPVAKTILLQNTHLRFLDGMEQRYRDSGGPLHRWVIRLERLDDGELAAFGEFFRANQGRSASFSFTDPWDGKEYANCSLASDELLLAIDAEMRCSTSITVVENRG
jgi:hypothetical protein